MKGQVLAYGFIALIFIIGSASLIKLVSSSPVEQAIATSEGKLISFENYVELLMRTFDQSVETISQKTAYDLGLKGGMSKDVYWTEFYPTADILELELEKAIEKNLPQGKTTTNREIAWGMGSIDAKDYDTTCGPTEDSTCFIVNGEKHITIRDESIDTTVFLNPHEFETRVPSNYFKLMNAALAAMQDFSKHLTNAGDFVNALYAAKASKDNRFNDLDFYPVVDGNIVTIHIWEKCYPSRPETYCLSPLSKGEIGLTAPDGNLVPYDYNRFVFKYRKEQTGFTDLVSDFALVVYPNYGTKIDTCDEP